MYGSDALCKVNASCNFSELRRMELDKHDNIFWCKTKLLKNFSKSLGLQTGCVSSGRILAPAEESECRVEIPVWSVVLISVLIPSETAGIPLFSLW